jgi:CRISPR/Cas system-associated endoribonuclease Cas2
MLKKHGCSRVQKSVYVAAFLEKKHLVGLQLDLQRLFTLLPLGPGDSVLFIPLREEYRDNIEVMGHNNILTDLGDWPLQMIL